MVTFFLVIHLLCQCIKPCTFLHLSSNEKSLTLDLCHFWFDVSPTTYGQGIRRNIPGVKAQHAGDGIPEGRLTVAAITIGDDQRLHVNLTDGSKPANHLDVIDELLIVLEDEIQAVQPNQHAFLVWRNAGDLGDKVLRRMLPGSGHTLTKIKGCLWGTERKAVCIQVTR